MQKIKNQNYRRFLDTGIIETINEEHIHQALKNIKGKHTTEGKALLILHYYTGARPNELLQENFTANNITREKNKIRTLIPGSKGGRPRIIYFNYTPLAKILWQYIQTLHPNIRPFYHYANKYTRTTNNKKRTETTDKLRYHYKKWFHNILPGSITPYYLRHNRFSKLSMAGVTLQDIQQLKGAKTIESVSHYIHLNTHKAKSIATKNK